MKNRTRSSRLMRFGLSTATAAWVAITAASSLLIAAELNDNARPFDFSDAFYLKNGINLQELNSPVTKRFGFLNGVPVRQTGAPAGPGQLNWVVDNTNTDPNRNNIRILATTGGYKDDTGSPTQFISIIAFLPDLNIFTTANQTGGAGNARGIAMQDIASDFEAYAGLKQVGPDGVFRPTPCASVGDPVQVAKGNCFSVASVETPHLRQDWRFSTNRNAIDGSSGPRLQSYFGDNLIGFWIVTYFWYTDAGFGPHQTPDCKAALDFLAARNGLTLDGTPLIKTGAELHFVEGALVGNEVRDFPPPPTNACAAENNLDRGGRDKGPVWLVCPSIPDPTRGGIAREAFLDAVRKPNGSPVDPQIAASFSCLQSGGQFCRLPSGTYMVKNQDSGLFWDGSAAPGVQLAALNTSAGAPGQQWTFTARSDGTYRIVNAASGLELGVPSGQTPGTAVLQTKGDGDSDDRWMVTPLNNGFRITNVANRLTVDATTDTPAPGTSVVEATPNGETRQIWVIR